MIFLKIKSAPKVGQYKPTLIDKQKSEAQLLLKQCAPKIVYARVKLQGSGITPLSIEGRYKVTNSAWEKLEKEYTWTIDF